MNTAISNSTDLPTEEIFSDEINGYLQYKIISTRDPYIKDKTVSTVYSIAVIELKEIDIPEYFFMYDIARSRDKALTILNCLQRNAVTPCLAGNVLQDII